MTSWTPGPAWLFCPADRPDRYAKALDCADVVILDLEDAVAATNRATAREALRRTLTRKEIDRDRIVVRISPTNTEDGRQDLELVEGIGIERVMLAKAEQVEQVERIPAHVIALIETARGVVAAEAIAAASNVAGIMWGAEDLIADLGGTSSRHGGSTYYEVAMYARSRALIAAKAHGRYAIDAVFMDIANLEGLQTECESAVAVGFDATAAIHPSQTQVIRSCYLPTDEQVAWAQRLLAHVGDNRRVTTFEGNMVDGPVYRQAERILHLATKAPRHMD